ncbi:hypothetical protein niasHT_027034 [Heterodera trifolii]|uniref:Vesicle-fusing ATPase n=1 Tax=Heterodera trifolii TaxID=157864 RepID=A0ABD2JT62_9BILA
MKRMNIILILCCCFLGVHLANPNSKETEEESRSILRLKVTRLPSSAESLTNKVYVNESDIDANLTKYVKVLTGRKRGDRLFHAPEKMDESGSWPRSSDSAVFVASDQPIITSISLIVDFQKKPSNPSEPLDTNGPGILMQFANTVFTVSQEFPMEYVQQKRGTGRGKLPPGKVNLMDSITMTTTYTLKLVVEWMEGAVNLNTAPEELSFGPLSPNAVKVVPSCAGQSDWNFQQLGIGGLDKKFSSVFRRAFASRIFPPEFIEQMAMKHVRGILLYGPPGTGKTLIARQIGKMLNAREPKIVNGPEILSKFVGESEANMRKLFADAEEEWRRCGPNSGLHIIIFDEIDAICKQRGSMGGSSTGVHDTVVNQLLTKMDGVEQLNNILVIGMTNRKDMLDEALLRPGRMEVQLEISLPDEQGRVQILNIHTAPMREYNKLDSDVNIEEIAKRTKNFSGAELEGLVRAAQSSAMNRLVKPGGKVQQVDDEAIDKLKVTADDFDYALLNDVKPSFGLSDEQLNRLLYGGLCLWGDCVSRVLEEGRLLIKETAAPDTRGFVRALLTGPPNTGKSFLAAQIAKDSEFPFIKVCTPEEMVGYSEAEKCAKIRKIFEDAYKSPLSCVIIDNVERLMDYSPIGPRYSNMVLQTLLVLLAKRPPQNQRLLVLATTSNEQFLYEADMLSVFSKVIRVEQLHTVNHVMAVLEEANVFSEEEIRQIEDELRSRDDVSIGIKRMLELLDFVKQSEQKHRVQLLLDGIREAGL